MLDYVIAYSLQRFGFDGGQDKWRNLSVMVNGWGSRDKCKTVTRRMPQVPKQEDNSMALSTGQSDEEIMDAKPIPASSDSQQVSAPKRSIVRLDMSLFSQFFFFFFNY